MNKLALGLAVSSVALAVSNAWLVNEVRSERARLGAGSSALPMTAGPSGSSGADGKSTTASPRQTKDGASAPSASGDAPKSGGLFAVRASREVQVRLANETLVRMYNDPQGRRELIEERIPAIRDRYLPLQRKLKVDDLQWLRFMEAVAERDLGFNAARADCQATNTCDRLKPTSEMFNENQRLIAEVLGDDKAERVRQFDDSQAERTAIDNLQRETPENLRLVEDRAEELVAALAKVRNDAARRMTAAQTPVGHFFDFRGGMLLYDKNLPTAEARLEAAADYSKRLREQARKYLSDKPMAAFNRQQDALLERMRASGGGEPAQ